MGAFTDFGNAIGEAFMKPELLRIQADEMRRSKEKEKKKDEALETYAATMGKKYGPEYENAVRSGEGVGDLLKLREASKKGSGGGGGKSEKLSLPERIVLYSNATKKLGQMAGEASQKAKDALAKGDQTAAAAAMEDVKKFAEAAEGMKTEIQAYDSTFRMSMIGNMTNDLNKTMDTLEEPERQLVSSSFDGALKKRFGLSQSVLDKLNSVKDENKIGMDLSGIPDSESVYDFFMTSIMNKKISLDDAKTIMNTEDPDDLVGIANEEGLPNETRLMAGLAAKTLLASPWISAKRTLKKK